MTIAWVRERSASRGGAACTHTPYCNTKYGLGKISNMPSTPSPSLRSPGTLEPITWSRGFAASAAAVAREFISSRSLQPIKAVVLGPPGGHQSHVCKQASSALVYYIVRVFFSQSSAGCLLLSNQTLDWCVLIHKTFVLGIVTQLAAPVLSGHHKPQTLLFSLRCENMRVPDFAAVWTDAR